MNQSGSAALCTAADEVALALSAGAAVVAITPEAAWVCQQRGEKYLRLEDYYSAPDLLACSPRIFETHIAWMCWADGFLRENVPGFGASGYYPAKATFFLLRNFFNDFYGGAHILRQFIAAVQPRRILYKPWVPCDPRGQPGDFAEPIYGSILPEIASKYGCALEAFPSNAIAEHPEGPEAAKQPRPPRWKSGRAWYELRLAVKTGFPRWFGSLLREGRTHRNVLFMQGGYDLDELAIALRNAGFSVRWAERRMEADADVGARLRELWPTVLERKEFWTPLDLCGLEPNLRAERGLGWWWLKMIPAQWNAYKNAVSALPESKVDAVVSFEGGGTTGPESAFLQAARSLGIASVIYQHGGTSRIPALQFTGLQLNSTDLFVYGSGTAELIGPGQTACVGGAALTHVVGSSRLDGLRPQLRRNVRSAGQIRSKLRASDSRPMVLYVPTHYNSSGRAFTELAGYADVEYFELQQRILRVFAEFPDIRLLYKDFVEVRDSLNNPIPSFLRKYVPNASTITSPPPLSRLLAAVDGIILDHAITALGEALMTDRRIIVYDHAATAPLLETPDATEALRKRAVVAGTADEFEGAVRAFLEQRDFSPVRNADTDYLLRFCTQGDGLSAVRATAEILNLTSAQRGSTARLAAQMTESERP